MADQRNQKQGWRARRRQARRDKAERTGDTPEKLAERDRATAERSAKDAAGQASIGAAVNGLPQ